MPDLTNAERMAAWGRRSALLSAKREASEALRDASTRCQSAEPANDLREHAQEAKDAADRLLLVCELWGSL